MDRQPTETELKVYSLITQNTGAHFLDSGGAYGRHWERNSKHPVEDFIQSPKVILYAHYYPNNHDLYGIKSLFHHLVDNLEYDKHMDDLFQRFVNMNEQAYWEYWEDDWKQYNYNTHQYESTGKGHGYGDWSWEDAMNDFYKLASKDRRGRNYEWNSWEFQGESYHEYTYNTENCLSQDFIYHVMGEYVFIQTHNGCDARGGFSYPVLFKLSGNNEYGLLDYDTYTIGCKEGHWWDYQGGYENTEQEISLKKCEGFDLDDDEYIASFDEDMKNWLQEQKIHKASRPLPGMKKPKLRAKPVLVPHGKIGFKDDKAYCPVCGSELYADCY